MSVVDPLLDRKAIERAFRQVGDRLARRGLVADIYVFAGAAMALAYDARRATRDIDVVPDAEVRNVGNRTVGDGEIRGYWWQSALIMRQGFLRPQTEER